MIAQKQVLLLVEDAYKLLFMNISKQLDAVRQIGNFSAHPIKSQNTGEIVNVETGEAKWCLDILQSLFEFCYVQPKIAEEKMEELNKKLAECGKPLLKDS